MSTLVTSLKSQTGAGLANLGDVFQHLWSSSTQSDFADTAPYAPIPDWWCLTPTESTGNRPLSFSSVTGSSALYDALTLQVDQAPDELELLSLATSANDARRFTDLAAAIQWERRSAEEILDAIRAALSLGAHYTARRLAKTANRLHPQHAGIQKAFHILAGPPAAPKTGPADPAAQSDMEWLKTQGKQYRGQWVALRAGILIARAASSTALLAQLDDPKDTSLLITKVY